MKHRHATQPTKRIRQATRLWDSEYVSREINKANRLAWLRSVELLGDKWLLASPVNLAKETK